MKLKRDNGGFRLSNNRFIGAENLKRFSRAETPLKPKEDKNSDHFILSVASETAIWRDYWQLWEKIIVSEQTLDLRFLSSQRSPI